MARRATAPPLLEFAPAKINLTLRVVGRRADGYHEIESLVAFARIGDQLSFAPGADLVVSVAGPAAAAVGPAADNLVLKAAGALRDAIDGLTVGHFHLTKRLPVAAGLGGGSADAAAALRLLARLNRIGLDDPRLLRAAIATGADVPVCLARWPRVMRGIGEVLSKPLGLPLLPAVLVNPRQQLATKDVFAWFDLLPDQVGSARPMAEIPRESQALVSFLAEQANDLEAAAIAQLPAVAHVLAALRSLDGCRLARMSGSGASCFALFESSDAAAAAARHLRRLQRYWWVRATALG